MVPQEQRISICIPIKNRSIFTYRGQRHEIFPRAVRRLVDIFKHHAELEIIIVDGNSIDWPLDQWVSQELKNVPHKIVSTDLPFSRGKYTNLAVQNAQTNNLLLMEAGMLLSPRVISRGLELLRAGTVFMPYYVRYRDAGFWFKGIGTGNVVINTETFWRVGGWPESATGHCDTLFMHALVVNKVKIVRELIEDFEHIWHPGWDSEEPISK